jgi:transcriptional regulator with XRE-family HTH domain
LDPSYISLLESEKRAPSDDALKAITEALGVPDSLLKLLAAEPAELRGINEKDAVILAKQLVEVLVSTSSRSGESR